MEIAWALAVQSASGLTLPLIWRVGIMAGQAHLAARTVADQKILRDQIFGLHMRIVADVHSMFPLTSLTAPVGSAVLPLATSDATRSMLSFSGKLQAERMRGLQVAAEDIP